MAYTMARQKLDRIFKVQLTDEQADELLRIGARDGLSAAAAIRQAVIRQYNLSPNTPEWGVGSQNGTDGGEGQPQASNTAQPSPAASTGVS